MNVKNVIKRYGTGLRTFVRAVLPRADLSGVTLVGADFSEANLRDAHFEAADLRSARFVEAKLFQACLAGANLQGADLCRADIASASLERANLSRAHLRRADLRCSNLAGANLSGATLQAVDLTDSVLVGSDLSNADLTGADLTGADLTGADLTGANLTGANLGGCVLRQVSLRNSNLSWADFCSALLVDVDVGGAFLRCTLFVDVNAFAFAEAEPAVSHAGPSSVDHRTILHSLRAPHLRQFLQACGMPEVFVEYNISCAQSLDGSILHKMLRSTFISYGGPDEAFARKLYEALARNGVTTFFFAEHAVPGKKLHDTMRDGVNEHDRMVLVCSKESLARDGVQNEIEQALAREARAGGEACLIPIRLDNYVFDKWAPKKAGMKLEVCDRVVADFRGADADPAKFDAAVLRLVAALKV